MPLFRMIIHGRGKFVLGKDKCGTVHEADGFYTTRWCHAASEDDAKLRGITILRREWTTGISAHMDPDQTLTMEIDKIWRIGVLDIWRAPNRGHSFYSETTDAGDGGETDQVEYRTF